MGKVSTHCLWTSGCWPPLQPNCWWFSGPSSTTPSGNRMDGKSAQRVRHWTGAGQTSRRRRRPYTGCSRGLCTRNQTCQEFQYGTENLTAVLCTEILQDNDHNDRFTELTLSFRNGAQPISQTTPSKPQKTQSSWPRCPHSSARCLARRGHSRSVPLRKTAPRGLRITSSSRIRRWGLREVRSQVQVHRESSRATQVWLSP